MIYYDDFSKWLDSNLEQLPAEVVAVNFNLYKGSNQTYDIQLIGSDKFDETDDEWACNEIFTTGEDIFIIQRTEDIEDFGDGLAFIIKMIEKYLKNEKCTNILKRLKVVGVGFVDGDIELVYRAKN